jgi:tRNA threonylcarbamoyladenosine biosynthesis protein TsaE
MIATKPEPGTFEVVTDHPDQTMRLGRLLGEILPPGFFVALVGSLGAGKTVLTKGLARGLGVEDDREVTSPSFVLVNEYRGRLPVYHLDLYRLESYAEVEGIGWDEFVSGPGVTLVEWADKVMEELPAERIDIHLQWVGEEQRRLIFSGKGGKGRCLVEEFKHKWEKEN